MDSNKLLALENELMVLRQRIEFLERQLRLTDQSYSSQTDCQVHGFNTGKRCAFCQEAHPIQTCGYFKYLHIGDRWKVAKKLRLCYRCLEISHFGRNCPYSIRCGVNRCRLTHHVLLHDEEKRKNRRLRTEQHQVANRLEPSCRSINSLDSFGDYEGQSDLLEGSPGHVCADSLNSCDEDLHAGCDSKIDCQQMAELNRLSMLAETSTEIPFELIFSGSFRNKKSLRSEYVTHAPSGGDDSTAQSECLTGYNEAEMTPESFGGYLDSQDTFNDGIIAPDEQFDPSDIGNDNGDRHADTVLASDTDNMDETIEPSNNDLVWPSGGEIGGLYRSQYSPCDEINRDTDSLDLTDATAAACDDEADSKDPVMSVNIEASSESLNASWKNVLPLGYKTTENVDYSSISALMENAVKQLSQKYRTNDGTSTLLDTLNNQICRLDKEIQFYDTTVSTESPA